MVEICVPPQEDWSLLWRGQAGHLGMRWFQAGLCAHVCREFGKECCSVCVSVPTSLFRASGVYFCCPKLSAWVSSPLQPSPGHLLFLVTFLLLCHPFMLSGLAVLMDSSV